VTALDGPDGTPVVLRRATESDARAVLAHLRRSGGETPFLSFGEEGPDLTEDDERDYLADTARSDNGIALLAEWRGEIVGCLTFNGGRRPRLRHVGELGISIARSCWGIGLGRRMISDFLAWAAAGGVVRKVNLRVRVDNDRAIALYESLGFVTEGRLTRDTAENGEFFDALLMGRAVD
jgi:RimJ/RimL family protein N-acetyltransferase